MKKIILVLLIFSFKLFATAQIPESIIINNNEYALFSQPLEVYIRKMETRPVFSKMVLTSCWRGYIGTWEIKDKYLYLVSLRKVCDEEREDDNIPLSTIFENQVSPIKASWFSGVLHIPRGKMIKYVHGGYESKFEEGTFLNVKEGKVTYELIANKKLSLTRSVSDFALIALGNRFIKSDKTWYDARYVSLKSFDKKETKEIFTTRGLYEGNHIIIPSTLSTPLVYISLDNSFRGKYYAVEIDGYFIKENDFYKLHVVSIRELQHGETMHHLDFKLLDFLVALVESTDEQEISDYFDSVLYGLSQLGDSALPLLESMITKYNKVHRKQKIQKVINEINNHSND